MQERIFKPIPQPLPLAEMAFQVIRDSILEGHLEPGKIYNEIAIAKELGISRTPVREALLKLATHGLITYLPRKGITVNDFTERDLEEIIELRKAIELAAIEKITMAPDSCDFSEAEKALKNQKTALKKKDIRTFLLFDRHFHLTLIKLTRNRRFVEIMENVRDVLQLIAQKILTDEQGLQETILEHEAILNAAKQGDTENARKAVRYHLDLSKKMLLEKMGMERKKWES